MATLDPEKRRASQRRYRQRKHAERFGVNAGDQRGRHGKHAREYPCQGDMGGCLYLATGACPACGLSLCDQCEANHGCADEWDEDDEEFHAGGGE